MAQDWDIKTRSEACDACEAEFADQQRYFSCLTFGGEGYARADYCEPCWSARPTDGVRHSVWNAVFRTPPPPAAETLRKETAETLLRKLIEDHDPARRSVIYILAVMLERKRMLVERDVQVQDGAMTRIYEHRQTGETFVVHDPHLKLNELESVQREVAELLGAPDRTVAPAEVPVEVPATPEGGD